MENSTVLNSCKKLVASNPSGDVNDFKSIVCSWESTALGALAPEHVRVRVRYSSINYKDALAITGNGKILRALPLTPGIDASGIVVESNARGFSPNEEVLITGCGLGETINGGLSQFIDVPASAVIARPKNLSLRECMILGTAGFTAGLALHQLEHNGLKPETAPVLVTGATGGVGSLAVLMLKKRGYQVEAWSRKAEEASYLQSLGVDVFTNIKELDCKTRSLESAQWAAAIDNVGGDILSFVLPRILPHGGVASIGLAKSADLHTTVFPFILRGVNLLGISSSTCPRPLRETIWSEISALACQWERALSATLAADQIVGFAEQMIAGKTTGRAIVDVNTF